MSSVAPSGRRLNRRAFLGGALSALPLAYGWPRLTARAQAPAQAPASPKLIVRQEEPQNLEFPFASLDRFLTPNDLFYVRNHFPQPKLDPARWRLKVEGAVERSLELSLEDLRNIAPRTVTATLECAGNTRSRLFPKAKGVPWDLGAVSNAEWSGVPLAAVLARAGIKNQAVEVILEGADSGEIKDDPKPAGPIHFARSLPVARASQNNVLLAYQMGHAELPAAHGFPLRAVVPGWYGMASVKWLTRVIVTDRPFHGFFQSIDYSYFAPHDGLVDVVPITAMQVKSELARPTRGETVPAGKEYRVHGAAWTGGAEVAKVEVSTDGGKTWAAARLLGRAVPHAWRLWEYAWKVPGEPGRRVVMARATDSRGRTQPLGRDPNRRNYVINQVLPTEVNVR